MTDKALLIEYKSEIKKLKEQLKTAKSSAKTAAGVDVGGGGGGVDTADLDAAQVSLASWIWGGFSSGFIRPCTHLPLLRS